MITHILYFIEIQNKLICDIFQLQIVSKLIYFEYAIDS